MTRWIEKIYKKSYERIFKKEWNSINDFKIELQFVNASYEISKLKFQWIYRDLWERYFEHLKDVAYIILDELDNPNVDKVVIALLHDIIEDIPWISHGIIEWLFWRNIANGIDLLSKKHINEYLHKLTEDQLSLMNESEHWKVSINLVLKEIRNEDYFWHMETLSDDILDVKFADRIHNLRTLGWCSENKIKRKINETKKYFLKLAEKRNIKALNLMKQEILQLEKRTN